SFSTQSKTLHGHREPRDFSRKHGRQRTPRRVSWDGLFKPDTRKSAPSRGRVRRGCYQAREKEALRRREVPSEAAGGLKVRGQLVSFCTRLPESRGSQS